MPIRRSAALKLTTLALGPQRWTGLHGHGRCQSLPTSAWFRELETQDRRLVLYALRIDWAAVLEQAAALHLSERHGEQQWNQPYGLRGLCTVCLIRVAQPLSTAAEHEPQGTAPDGPSLAGLSDTIDWSRLLNNASARHQRLQHPDQGPRLAGLCTDCLRDALLMTDNDPSWPGDLTRPDRWLTLQRKRWEADEASSGWTADMDSPVD